MAEAMKLLKNAGDETKIAAKQFEEKKMRNPVYFSLASILVRKFTFSHTAWRIFPGGCF
jgi:hypothetical protein